MFYTPMIFVSKTSLVPVKIRIFLYFFDCRNAENVLLNINSINKTEIWCLEFVNFLNRGHFEKMANTLNLEILNLD